MFGKSSAILLIAAFLEALPVNADGLYTKNSPVLQVDGSNYDRLIARSNHASIVEFYAPWCGHCQNLKPAFEKAAKNLDGLAKVAAVNCDEDSNKQFCGQMGVQGFPTLKIVVPSKKPGKPRVEDYQGARTAKAIVDAVVDKIPNHVKRVTDNDLNTWLEEEKETSKAILFTEKGTTSALLRALAIDYLGSINFAQIRNKEASAVQKFGVDKFPTLVLLPGGDKEAITYDGEMKKQPMSKFLSQAAEPNPDPASKQSKSSSKSKKASKSSTSTVSDDEASKATESSEPSTHTPSANEPPKPPPLQILINNEDLRNACLSSKSGTCVLVLVSVPEPSDSKPPPAAIQSFSSLAEISHKHSQRGGHLFPFYVVPDNAVEDVSMLRNKLELSQDGAVEIIAVNAKRGWWRRYDAGEENSDFSVASLESWIDAIRLGEGAKKKLPEGVVPEAAEEPEEPVKEPEPEPEPVPEQEAGEPEEPVVGGEAEQEPLEEKPSGHSEL